MNLLIPRPVITVMASERHEGFAGLQITYGQEGEIQDLLQELESQARLAAEADSIDFDGPGVFMLGIIMPCGSRILFRRASDVPREDVECPCGDRLHWVVRYQEKVECSMPAAIWP